MRNELSYTHGTGDMLRKINNCYYSSCDGWMEGGEKTMMSVGRPLYKNIMGQPENKLQNVFP